MQAERIHGLGSGVEATTMFTIICSSVSAFYGCYSRMRPAALAVFIETSPKLGFKRLLGGITDLQLFTDFYDGTFYVREHLVKAARR
jgi:hypothetical protein